MLFAAACGRVSKPQGFAEPQLDGDTLYVSLNAGKMAAVNATDFSVIWEFPKDDDFACGQDKSKRHDLQSIYGSPVVDGDRVYFGAYDGNMYGLDARTGDCLWESHKSRDPGVQCKREPDGPIVGGAALHEGVLYVGSDDGQVYGIDAETGDVHFCLDVGGAVWSTPLIADNTLYVATMNGEVRAVEPGDWHPKWRQPFRTSAGLLTDPVLAGDKLIVGGIGETLFALDVSDGEEVWSFPAGNWFWGRPLVDGKTVYATNLDGKVYAVDVDSGRPAWESNTFKAPEAIRAAPLLTGGALVVVDRGGNVYSLDPDTGEVLKSEPAVIEKRVLANPIELDGDVLLLAQSGDMYRWKPAGDEPPRRVEVLE